MNKPIICPNCQENGNEVYLDEYYDLIGDIHLGFWYECPKCDYAIDDYDLKERVEND